MVTLKEAKILEQWAVVLERCQGEEEALLRSIEDNLKSFETPGMTWSRETVSPGWLKGLFGKKRDFLIVTHERFDDYTFYVYARDYGTLLDVSWFLAGSTKNPIVKAVENAAGYIPGSAIFRLDVFDQQDLRAYAMVGKLAVQKAVEELRARKKLEAEIDWKSKGVLGL